MSDPRSNRLPDGWREAYYDSETEEEFTFVTAVYEHVELGIKTVIVPDYPNESVRLDDAKNAGHTRHRVVNVYPVYEDVGLQRTFTETTREMRDTANSVVPEVRPRGDAPNRNSGPYSTQNGRPRSMTGSQRAAEGTFDWENELPDEAIESIRTYKQYPLDYGPVMDDFELLMEADSLAIAEPGAVPEPFPVSVIVQHDAERDESMLQLDPLSSDRFREKVISRFKTGTIDLADFEDGDCVATVFVEFQRDSFPYDPNIVRIETPDDEPLPLAGPVSRFASLTRRILQ